MKATIENSKSKINTKFVIDLINFGAMIVSDPCDDNARMECIENTLRYFEQEGCDLISDCNVDRIKAFVRDFRMLPVSE